VKKSYFAKMLKTKIKADEEMTKRKKEDL